MASNKVPQIRFNGYSDEEQDNDRKKSPIITILLTYLSVCAGCVLAIFLPVMVGESFNNFLIALLIIALLTIIVVFIVRWGGRLRYSLA